MACGRNTGLRVKGSSSCTSSTSHLLGDFKQETLFKKKKEKEKRALSSSGESRAWGTPGNLRFYSMEEGGDKLSEIVCN